MKTSFVSVILLLLTVAPQPTFADPQTEGTCSSDSKLLNGGPTQVFGVGPGTYWNLIEAGLQSAFGNDEAAKVQYLSGVFGQQFATLDEARDYNLNALSTGFDTNQNGMVCVYDLRGTRANFRDPYSKNTYFSISDDKISKKADDALRFRTVSGR